MERPEKDSPRDPRAYTTPRADTGVAEQSPSATSLNPVQELEFSSPRMRTPSPKRKYGDTSVGSDVSESPPSSKKDKTESKEAKVTGPSEDQSHEKPLEATAITSSGTQTRDSDISPPASSSSSADHSVIIEPSKDQKPEQPLTATAVTTLGTQTGDSQGSSSSSGCYPASIDRSSSEDSEKSAGTMQSIESLLSSEEASGEFPVNPLLPVIRVIPPSSEDTDSSAADHYEGWIEEAEEDPEPEPIPEPDTDNDKTHVSR